MGGWTNVSRVGQIFGQGVTMQNYFPNVISVNEPNFPWSIYILGSTDHSSTGGIYAAGLKIGLGATTAANYETYNQAVARGAFDYLSVKPSANPIYTDTDSDYDSTETPCANKVGSQLFMTAQVGITGSDQPTLLTKSTDFINFTNYDRGDGAPFIDDGNVDDNFPAKDLHRGYKGWGLNPFAGVNYTYVSYQLHGGGDRPLNIFKGSNDGENWESIAIVTDYQFPDNPDVPADWGIWWNGIDVKSIRDAGGGEYSMVVSIGDKNHGGAARQSKIYEIFVADDGVTVTRQPRLLLDVGGNGAPDSDEISAPSFLYHDGQWLMFYQGADVSARNSLMLATVEWDETLAKPDPITRPDHKKYTVHMDDGAFPATMVAQNGTPSFNASGIEFTSAERIKLVDAVVPDNVGYIEIFTKQTGNGTDTARLINTVADSLASNRAVNGVELITYSTGVYIQQTVAGSAGELDVTTSYPLNQNNDRSNMGIRWDVADDKLWFLVGDGQCKNVSASTIGVDTSLPMSLIVGNINLGTISVEEITFRVGTSANDGIAPTVLVTPNANSTSVLFTFSESCIGDASGIVIKEGVSTIAGTWTRPTLTTARFTRSSGQFAVAPTYDIVDTDIRNADLVQIQNVSAQSIDFTASSSLPKIQKINMGFSVGL